MTVANIYRKLKRILIDSNEALINIGLNKISTLDEVSNEIKKLGTINRLPYAIRRELIDLNEEDFGEGLIRSYVFSGCNHLKTVTIPDSVTSINHHAFNANPRLTNVTIPTSVTKIDQSLLQYCDAIESLTIPFVGSSPTSAEQICYFFGEESNYDIPKTLKNVIILDAGAKIGSGCFQNCKNVESVTLPDNITYISTGVFSGCTSLKSIVIPKNVTHIHSRAFHYCENLKDVYLYPVVPPVINYGDYTSFNSEYIETIHVPIGYGDAYKSATNWSVYASKIIEDIIIE